MLARTTDTCGISVSNLSVVKDMKWQTYRKRLVMVSFRDEVFGVPLSL